VLAVSCNQRIETGNILYTWDVDAQAFEKRADEIYGQPTV